MCGRFTLRTSTKSIADLFSGLEVDLPDEPIEPNYNVAPTHTVAAVRNQHEQNEFAFLRWGLLPSWAKEKKLAARMINARGETVSEKPAFRAAFKRRRCLVIADGFYEWLTTPDGKQPMYVTMKDDRPFAMAGLWEVNKKATDEKIESCTVITTSANPLMLPIHDRMPVILPPERFEMWLDPGFENADALQELLQPFDENKMTVRPVAKNVNKVAYNQSDCIDEIAVQGDLF